MFSLPECLFSATDRTEMKRFSGQKLSYFSLQGDEPLRADTIGNVVDNAAEKYGTKEAVVVCHQNIRKNFIEFKQDIDKLAAGFIAIGLEKGDRIGIWSPNNYEWLLTQFAAAKTGLILVNINLAYQTRELEYCLTKAGIRAVVSAESFKTQKYYEIFREIIPSLSKCKPGKIENSNPGLKNLTHLIMISDQDYGGAYKIKEVMDAADSSHYKQLQHLQNKIDFDDAVNIQFTSFEIDFDCPKYQFKGEESWSMLDYHNPMDVTLSIMHCLYGTTGFPKGATLSHHNMINNCYLAGRRLRYHEKPHRICVSVPLYHCFGCVEGSLLAMLFGACQIYPAPTFSANACARTIQSEKCTVVYGTPTMFIDILKLPDFENYDLSSLFTGITGGANCPTELLKSVMNKLHAHQLAVCYGCTELSPILTQTKPDDTIERRTTTVGSILPHAEIKLVDANGSIVPCGSPGEVLGRGYMVMLGYWNDEAKTAECITPDRWYKTGDLGVIDENGYLKIIGRIKDMINRGGENIYPKEIEDVLHTHPKIVEAYVVGVPDERLGEVVCAWINLKSGEDLTVEEVKTYCKGKIAHFKIPRHVKFVDSFPMTVTGKVQKFVIRDKVIEELNLKQ